MLIFIKLCKQVGDGTICHVVFIQFLSQLCESKNFNVLNTNHLISHPKFVKVMPINIELFFLRMSVTSHYYLPS